MVASEPGSETSDKKGMSEKHKCTTEINNVVNSPLSYRLLYPRKTQDNCKFAPFCFLHSKNFV